MDLQLCVQVCTELHGNHVRLVVTGKLTEDNQSMLHPVIRRFQALVPTAKVIVDLTSITSIEPAAVELLRRHSQPHAAEPAVGFMVILPAGTPQEHRTRPSQPHPIPQHHCQKPVQGFETPAASPVGPTQEARPQSHWWPVVVTGDVKG